MLEANAAVLTPSSLTHELMTDKKRRKAARSKLTLKEHLEQQLEELKTCSNFGEDLPRKWEKHGDLVLLPQNCFEGEIWTKIDREKLWSIVAGYFGVVKVAKKARIRDDGHRTPQVVLLKGDDPWVCHVDNKIKYSYDITKCMFSAGNITEKMRMAKLQCEDEVIVDMFAGIGYFTLPLLVHAKARHVHACEWNHDAVVALKKNLVGNKVEDRCTLHEGDNRKVCPENVADRVIMGLIPTAIESMVAACKALKTGKVGILLIHQNVDSKVPQKDIKITSESHILNTVSCNKKTILPEWATWAAKTAVLVQETMLDIHERKGLNSDVRTEVLHIEKVKSYAPHIDHMVLDLKVIVIAPSS